MDYFILIAIFLTIVLLIEGAYFVSRTLYDPERRRVRQRLHTLSTQVSNGTSVDIVRRRVLSDSPWMNNLLSKSHLLQRLGRLLEQANSRWQVGTFLVLCIGLFCLGLLLGPVVVPNPYFPILGSIVLGLTPLLYMTYRKKRRMQQFERQLPEALDLVTRALKAGHTFMVGLKMVGDEFSDPIGTEFGKTIDEINFGVSAAEALLGLAERVDCPDVNLFVTAVIVQRDTGGNLAEILEKTSQVIRQRFELLGRVRVLAAEGKLSAVVLIAFPFVVGLLLHVISPDYLTVLFTDAIGKVLMMYGAGMMVVGIVAIRKIVSIRV